MFSIQLDYTHLLDDSTEKVLNLPVVLIPSNSTELEKPAVIPPVASIPILTPPTVSKPQTAVNPQSLPSNTSHEQLMAEAGINASDYPYVEYIVAKESGWNTAALEPHTHACGIPQALPCSKMASAGADYLTNPVTQLRWMNGYVSRYGGWYGAYLFHKAHNWY